MKKYWILMFLVFLWVTGPVGAPCTKANAAPFATCDCTPATDEVTAFELKIGTGAYFEVPAVSSCGTGTGAVTCTGTSKTLCYDMTSQPIGPFSMVARAKNLWGSSADSDPLSGNKIIPTSPLHLKIIK